MCRLCSSETCKGDHVLKRIPYIHPCLGICILVALETFDNVYLIGEKVFSLVRYLQLPVSSGLLLNFVIVT